jgi:hypothetical protein
VKNNLAFQWRKWQDRKVGKQKDGVREVKKVGKPFVAVIMENGMRCQQWNYKVFFLDGYFLSTNTVYLTVCCCLFMWVKEEGSEVRGWGEVWRRKRKWIHSMLGECSWGFSTQKSLHIRNLVTICICVKLKIPKGRADRVVPQ